jgi:hypothetical protein
MKASLIALGLLLTLSILLSACDRDAGLNLEGPDADFGKSLVADLQSGNIEAIEARLDPAVRNAETREALKKMAGVLPSTPPTSIRVAGRNVTNIVWMTKAGETRRVILSLQYQFDDRWLLVHAKWRSDAGGPAVVESLNLQALPASLETLNRFTFEGKGSLHYAVLALAVALPIFSLVVLVLCLATPMPLPRKTLWALAILLGVGVLGLNWTTGAIIVQPLSIRVLSAGYIRTGLLGPWVVSISIPLGAIIFLFKRGSTRRIAAAAAS